MAKKTKTVAGKNEILFADRMSTIGISSYERHPSIPACKSGLKTSVDGMFTDGGKTYYVEVDSYNMAKTLLGQYILLNDIPPMLKNCIFVVVHFYKKYNPKRTKDHLIFAKSSHKCTIPVSVFHWDCMNDMSGITTKKDFMKLIRDNIL